MTISCPIQLENLLPYSIEIAVLCGGKTHLYTINSTEAVHPHDLDLDSLETLAFSPEGFQQSNEIHLSYRSGQIYFKNAENELCSKISLNFVERHPGQSNFFSCLEYSIQSSTGSHKFTISTPVWLYNYIDLPLSLSCSLSTEIARMVTVSDIENEGGALPFADIVPESWVPPIYSNSSDCGTSRESGLYSSRSSYENLLLNAHENLSPANSRLESENRHAGHSRSTFGLSSLLEEKILDSPGITNGELQKPGGEASVNSHHRPNATNMHAIQVLCSINPEFRLRISKRKAPHGYTYWSDPIRLSDRKCQVEARIPVSDSNKTDEKYFNPGEFPVVIKRSAADNELAPIRISFAPKYLIKNLLDYPIQYKQQGTLVETTILPNGSCSLYWSEANGTQRICIRILEAGWLWSGGFSLDCSGDTFVKIRHRDRGVTTIILANIYSDCDGVMWITLSSNKNNFTPYRIENCSLETLNIRQNGVVDQFDMLKPYCALNYALDEPFLPHRVIIETPGGKTLGAFDLDKVNSLIFNSSIVVSINMVF